MFVAEKRILSMELGILLSQVEELMGRRSLIVLLRKAGLREYIDRLPPLSDRPNITVAQYSALLANTYFTFGAPEARHIFVRTGRLLAVELRHRRASQFALAGTALKLLPVTKGMHYVLQKLADQGAEMYGASYQLDEDAEALFFEIADCPYCAEIARQGQERNWPVTRAVCHVPTAILEEMMEWITGEKHLVEEVACVALGADVCRFRIGK